MKIPKPLLLSLIALGLMALFVFLNAQPVRVHLIVYSDTMPAYALILASLVLGAVPSFALGAWVGGQRQRRKE